MNRFRGLILVGLGLALAHVSYDAPVFGHVIPSPWNIVLGVVFVICIIGTIRGIQ